MPTTRINLASRLISRDSTVTKDSNLRNFYREELGEEVKITKRPGAAVTATLTAGVAQGMFTLDGIIYAVIGDKIRNLSNVVIATIPTVITPNEPYDILSDVMLSGTNKAILKSKTGLWVFTAVGGAIKVTNVNYPALTVRGISFLDGTFYVLDVFGNLLGSAIEDPTSWTALNTIGVDQSIGAVQAVRRHLNYILVLGDHGCQAFYDAANPPPGSPLSPASNVMYLVGCATGDSVVSIDDNTVFIAKARQTGRSVQMFSGLTMVPISSPFVEKLLDVAVFSTVYAFGLRITGHSFYVLSISNLPYTLAYDMITKDWQIWSTTVSAAESYFQYGFPLSYETRGQPAQGLQYFQHLTNGTVVLISASNYTDSGQPIQAVARTGIFDGGISHRKFFSALKIISDTVATTVAVSFSDDDYTSYSVPRSVDLSTVNKQLRALGSSRYRSFRLTHADNTPLRLESIELEVKAKP